MTEKTEMHGIFDGVPTMAEIAMDYAVSCHNNTNHKYDKVHPYSLHLQMVVDNARKFIHLIPKEHRDTVIAGCWLHDVIEDCRVTYNDVKKATNEQIAELAYALTNEKGKNRDERANDKYYEGIRSTPFATFIKLCDRMANYEYSKKNGGKEGMAKKYEREMPEFISKLGVQSEMGGLYGEMADYLMSLSRKEIPGAPLT